MISSAKTHLLFTAIFAGAVMADPGDPVIPIEANQPGASINPATWRIFLRKSTLTLVADFTPSS